MSSGISSEIMTCKAFKGLYRNETVGSGASGQLLLGLTSLIPLDITVGHPLSRAVKTLEGICSQAAQVLAHPPSCTAAVFGFQENARHLGSSSFDLQNFTGLDVEFWLQPESQRDSPIRNQGAYC